MDKINKIKGFTDLLPPESNAYAHMETTTRAIFTRYGFKEIRIPIVEHTELFARSIGGETDIVQKEMYTFPDRKDRLLTLRPEATAGVVRAFIENNLYAQDEVRRFFTFGPMFRYERPQKGRQRQFHQIDAEVLGTESPLVDAELILMLWRFLDGLGLKNLALELNSLGCPQCRPAYKAALEAFFAGLDQDKLCDDCRRRAKTNPLRVLDCKVPDCKELTKNAPIITDHLCPDCVKHFETVKAVLSSAGIPYTLTPRLVRGLDYYQRTAFEVTSGNIGAQTAVAGGGRYDGLVKALGGPDVPGVGFACGMERLALLMGTPPSKPLDFYLAPLHEDVALADLVVLADKLRGQGYAGEVATAPRSMKSLLRYANKIGARYGLFVGQDEQAQGSVTVKSMESGEQSTVPVTSLLSGDIMRKDATA